jgi:hypothetical protein
LESNTKVVLISGDQQQAQEASQIITTGGVQRIALPQRAHTIRSCLIKKSPPCLNKHLQAKFETMPTGMAGGVPGDGLTWSTLLVTIVSLCAITGLSHEPRDSQRPFFRETSAKKTL